MFMKDYLERNKPNSPNKDFECIKEFENCQIEQRRSFHSNTDQAHKDSRFENPDGSDETVGLALSGGGVRSATFNLGILQALDHYGFLKRVDYLSTVSGGGYIGSSLSWFLHRFRRFPLPRFPRSDKDAAVVEWLRRHASYLVPGDGLDHWAFAAAIIRGVGINLIIIIPILYWISFVLRIYPESVDNLQERSVPLEVLSSLGIGYSILLVIGIGALSILFIRFILYPVAARISSLPISMADHRRRSVGRGRLLRIGIICIAMGVVPYAYNWINLDNANTISRLAGREVSSILSIHLSPVILGLLGGISIVAGWIGRSRSNENFGWRRYAIKIGLLVVLYNVALVFYGASENLAIAYNNILSGSVSVLSGKQSLELRWFLAGLVFSVALILTADINRVSLHKYYRNRLLEAYLPDDPPPAGEPVVRSSNWTADNFRLSQLEPEENGDPIQIINTTITTIGSRVPKYRIRGGDCFTFTPYMCGSESTDGWVPVGRNTQFNANAYTIAKHTDAEKDNGSATRWDPIDLDLPTAMAISGAAVDPNTGATRSRPLSIIMAFLNLRLGYWLVNPRKVSRKVAFRNRLFPMTWLELTLREMFGQLDETKRNIHLSDGGHFENLGLYELVRRRCKYIIVSDASADPNFMFGDLARAIERIRVDHNAEIEINTKLLHPDQKTNISSAPYVVGKIFYDRNSSSESTGHLIYLKSAVCAGLPEEIYGYLRKNDSFPDESTSNQFFGDQQFEAYRELGYRLAERIFLRGESKNIVVDLDKAFGVTSTAESNK